MNKKRELAIKIISEFEELLSCHNIKIPSSDREGNKEEACIYGTTYYNLEDKITDILKGFKEKPKKKKIKVGFSEEDLNDLLFKGRTFDWNFNGVDIHLFNEEFKE